MLKERKVKQTYTSSKNSVHRG